MNLTRTKGVEQSIADTEESDHRLRKESGPVQLVWSGSAWALRMESRGQRGK